MYHALSLLAESGQSEDGPVKNLVYTLFYAVVIYWLIGKVRNSKSDPKESPKKNRFW